jgi:Pyruvate/2-oxoacid:ferredoxin oxidoreductase gamma subunit
MGREDFKEVISKSMPEEKLDINLKAFDIGTSMIEQYTR